MCSFGRAGLASLCFLALWGCQGNIGDATDFRSSKNPRSPASHGSESAERPRESKDDPAAPDTTSPTDSPMQPPGAAKGALPICDDAQRGRSESQMRRLTTPEIVRSLRTVFGPVMDAAPVAAQLPTLPTEAAITPERGFDHRIPDVEALAAVGSAVAHQIASDTATARSVLDCDPQMELAKCQTALLDRVVRRLFRRPLTADEQSSYRAFMDDIGGIDGLELALVRAIASPRFHQHLELESTEASNMRRRVDHFAVASRVSFALTGALPDETLLAAAESGALGSLDALREHAARLIKTDAAHERLRNMLIDWLRIAPPDPAPAMAAALKIDGKGLGAEARSEFVRFLDYIVFERRGTFADLWTNDTVFPSSERLAAVFGVAQSSGPVRGSGAARGMFLRPAVLLTSAAETSPIVRGATMRRRALCEVFPTPDPALVAAGQKIQDGLPATEHSTRERATAATSGTFCQGCHGRINAMGFVLESFGPAGQWRQKQDVLDDNGKTLASFEIDARVSDLQLEDVGALDGPEQLGAKLATTTEAKQCFAERLFESSRMRASSDADGCLIRQLIENAPERPVLDVLVDAIVNEDVFYRAEVTP